MTRDDQADLMLQGGAGGALCSQTEIPCVKCNKPTCTVVFWSFCSSTGGNSGCIGKHKECYYKDGCTGPCTCGMVEDTNCSYSASLGICEGDCINSSTQQPCTCEC